MPTFDIIKEVKPKQTFRVASVIGKFDLQSEHIIEHFKGDIDINEKWQISRMDNSFLITVSLINISPHKYRENRPYPPPGNPLLA